jgi:UDPglucose 6-dehydrogenase
MVKKIRDALGGGEYGKTIAFFGLTFKPETDDMREAASLTIIPSLLEGGAIIHAIDPKGIKEAQKHLKGVEFFNDPYEMVRGADAIVIMTEWNEYRALAMDKLSILVKEKIFIDLKNIYEPDVVRGFGFTYTGVGIE